MDECTTVSVCEQNQVSYFFHIHSVSLELYWPSIYEYIEKIKRERALLRWKQVQRSLVINELFFFYI